MHQHGDTLGGVLLHAVAADQHGRKSTHRLDIASGGLRLQRIGHLRFVDFDRLAVAHLAGKEARGRGVSLFGGHDDPAHAGASFRGQPVASQQGQAETVLG